MPRPSLRLLSRDNGVGLSRDLRLLADVAASVGLFAHAVDLPADRDDCMKREARLWRDRLLHGRVDLQVFSERVYRRCLPLARCNVLIPNPEWLLDKWRPLLPRFDLILCKTHHAQRIFEALGCPTHYIGFTSDDRLDTTVPRQRAFFHLAGASSLKGTQVLMETWARHPEWPRLTVVQSPRVANATVRADNIEHRVGYLDDGELRHLQNAHRFHVCPSETEGFGHYLMEGLSVGAVVLATDAQPMNELVDATRGVPIRAHAAGPLRLAHRHAVSPESIEDAVQLALELSALQCEDLGIAARQFFQRHRRMFLSRMRATFEGLLKPAGMPLAPGDAAWPP
ncbi:glycosyltransferase [Lysobacter sp.]|uniref:glycosyltransferase n=1 Tax=Lysobacter sp. TaxID=72226 RepID=UPI002D630AF8|nr:glycosyltransferase [Lysobacter sp.]HZX76376.1 glycosyltransferase [Lysobacter sp.]